MPQHFASADPGRSQSQASCITCQRRRARASAPASKLISKLIPLISYSVLTNCHNTTNHSAKKNVASMRWPTVPVVMQRLLSQPSVPPPSPPLALTILLWLILLLQFFQSVVLLFCTHCTVILYFLLCSFYSSLQTSFLPSALLNFHFTRPGQLIWHFLILWLVTKLKVRDVKSRRYDRSFSAVFLIFDSYVTHLLLCPSHMKLLHLVLRRGNQTAH